MTMIKICGITNKEDAIAAVGLGADTLGFVFAKSPRSIEVAKAKEIIKSIPDNVGKTGVFVNEKIDTVVSVVKECGLDYAQLHGQETPEYCAELKAKGISVINVFKPKDVNDLRVIEQYDVPVIHLDTFSEEIQGGTGKVFNWELAKEAKKYGKSIILAGGLTPENVQEAIEKVEPSGVDVSSGVEEAPGKKDIIKMKKFVEIVRKYATK